MINLVLGLMYLLGGPAEKKYESSTYLSVCDRYIGNLSLDQKIEISMGCSKVKGRMVYSESKLVGIFDADFSEGKIQLIK